VWTSGPKAASFRNWQCELQAESRPPLVMSFLFSPPPSPPSLVVPVQPSPGKDRPTLGGLPILLIVRVQISLPFPLPPPPLFFPLFTSLFMATALVAGLCWATADTAHGGPFVVEVGTGFFPPPLPPPLRLQGEAASGGGPLVEVRREAELRPDFFFPPFPSLRRGSSHGRGPPRDHYGSSFFFPPPPPHETNG